MRLKGTSGERMIRNDIAQEVVAGIKERASALDEAKATAQRTAGQRVKQHWDSSQIETEEEEESWREGDQMAAEWDEEEKLERFWNEEGWKEAPCSRTSCERYRSRLCMNACHKAKGVKGCKEKKIVPGWSVEEMKGKPNIAIKNTLKT